jgi:hypothetical protein
LLTGDVDVLDADPENAAVSLVPIIDELDVTFATFDVVEIEPEIAAVKLVPIIDGVDESEPEIPPVGPTREMVEFDVG